MVDTKSHIHTFCDCGCLSTTHYNFTFSGQYTLFAFMIYFFMYFALTTESQQISYFITCKHKVSMELKQEPIQFITYVRFSLVKTNEAFFTFLSLKAHQQQFLQLVAPILQCLFSMKVATFFFSLSIFVVGKRANIYITMCKLMQLTRYCVFNMCVCLM